MKLQFIAFSMVFWGGQGDRVAVDYVRAIFRVAWQDANWLAVILENLIGLLALTALILLRNSLKPPIPTLCLFFLRKQERACRIAYICTRVIDL